MFRLSKKISNSIFISIILGFSIFAIGKNKNIIMSTSSIPVAEHIIVLDAGHGQPDRSELLANPAFQKKK